jgi:uncharacterized protein (TIGR02271 family)
MASETLTSDTAGSSGEFIREDGLRGAVVDRIAAADGSTHVVIAFPDGMRYELPETALPALPSVTESEAAEPQPLLRETVEDAGGRIIIPVIAEQLSVEKRRVPQTIVRVNKRVESRDEIVEQALLRQSVNVERIPINQIVDGEPPVPRQEGDVMIIPILEEVLVVEKRLMLIEEVRVQTQETTVQEPQTVTLRREVVDVERVSPQTPSPS